MQQQPYIPPEQSLIEYPVRFPIKVMGLNNDEFVTAMVAIAQSFEPGFDEAWLERRPSRAGNYLGLTISIHVTSREHLDDVYRALTSHALVKYVL